MSTLTSRPNLTKVRSVSENCYYCLCLCFLIGVFTTILKWCCKGINYYSKLQEYLSFLNQVLTYFRSLCKLLGILVITTLKKCFLCCHDRGGRSVSICSLHHSFPFSISQNGNDDIECIETGLEGDVLVEVQNASHHIHHNPNKPLFQILARQCPDADK